MITWKQAKIGFLAVVLAILLPTPLFLLVAGSWFGWKHLKKQA